MKYNPDWAAKKEPQYILNYYEQIKYFNELIAKARARAEAKELKGKLK